MRVLMLRTMELRVGERDVRFEKNTHVDVSDEQGKAWEAEEAAIEENVSGHKTPATPNLSPEKRKQLGLDQPSSGVAGSIVPKGAEPRAALLEE